VPADSLAKGGEEEGDAMALAFSDRPEEDPVCRINEITLGSPPEVTKTFLATMDRAQQPGAPLFATWIPICRESGAIRDLSGTCKLINVRDCVSQRGKQEKSQSNEKRFKRERRLTHT